MHLEDTICAPCTAHGGAIAIIRISGTQAINIVSQIFQPKTGQPLTQRKTQTLTFGNILTPTGETLDEVLVSLFRAPHSYTGEDTIEISCHDSQYIIHTLLEQLTLHGCRMAEPGEFTQRAYINGKMDLSQAEAVADVIAAQTAATHRLAFSQMRGNYSQQLHLLRDKLLHLTTLMELELDFSDHEDLEFADRKALKQLCHDIEQTTGQLADSFHLGNALKNGIPVAIIGDTNAGKSTLLNALLHEEKAIVSHIHGTTRDVIEDTINIDGTTFRFIDTAGIRQATDEIEKIGITRTFQKLRQADIILWVADITDTRNIPNIHQQIQPYCQGKPLHLLLNKCDQLSPENIQHTLHTLPPLPCPRHLIAAKQLNHPQPTTPIPTQTHPDNHTTTSPDPTTTNPDAPTTTNPDATTPQPLTLRQLEEILKTAADLPQIAEDSTPIVTNARHHAALSQARTALRRVLDGLNTSLPTDLLSQDLREALHHLAEITGEAITTDEVLHTVFSHFCVGK